MPPLSDLLFGSDVQSQARASPRLPTSAPPSASAPPIPLHPCADAPPQVCAAGAILNLLGPSLGPEDSSNAKRQGFKKLLSLALTVGMLNDALRADQTQMDPTASKPART